MPKPTRKYYNVHYPYLNVNTWQRFFFFNSLENKTNTTGAGYSGQRLAYTVTDLIKGGLNQLTEKKEENGLTIIDNAMNYLKQTIDYERKQEKKYFTDKILNNEEIPNFLKEKLKGCFQEEDDGLIIDYATFINIINNFYSGLESYKRNLFYEQDRIRELEELYTSFALLSKQQKKEYYEAAIRRKKSENDDASDAYYFEAFRLFLVDKLSKDKDGKYIDPQAEQAARALSGKTLDNLLQHELKEIFKNIWERPDFHDLIINTLKVNSIGTSEKTLIAFLITTFLKESKEELLSKIEINDTNKTIRIPAAARRELIKDFMRQLSNIQEEDLTDIDKMRTNSMVRILAQIKKIKNDSINLNRLRNRFLSNYELEEIRGFLGGQDKKPNSSNIYLRGGLAGLTVEIVNSLEPIIDQMLIDQNKSTYISPKKAKSPKERLIRKIERAFEGNNNYVLHYKRNKHKRRKYDTLERIIRDIISKNNLVTIKIKEKDNIFSEMSADQGIIKQINKGKNLLANRIVTTGLSAAGTKSDTQILDLADYYITPNVTDKDWEHIAHKITEAFLDAQTYDVEVPPIKPPSDSDFNEKQSREQKGFTAAEFFIQGETERRLNKIRSLINDAKNSVDKTIDAADECSKIIKILNNSFQISSTVKSYDKFNNSIGFKAGSLGGTLEHQIENIVTMFEYGGITDIDRDWLIFAVYNSSPETLGSNFKSPLEKFLTITASMLLFDDAGQQAQYVTQQALELYEEPQVNILHLYYLNGVYLPSSFVLQLTYDNLMEAQTILNGQKINTVGHYAHIINNVKEKDMVGQRGSDGKIYTVSQQNWVDTFEKNRKSVEIQMTFLAGFLDILDMLSDNLTKLSC